MLWKFWEWLWGYSSSIEKVKGQVPFWAKKEYLESKKAMVGSACIPCADPFPEIVRGLDHRKEDKFIYLF